MTFPVSRYKAAEHNGLARFRRVAARDKMKVIGPRRMERRPGKKPPCDARDPAA